MRIERSGLIWLVGVAALFTAACATETAQVQNMTDDELERAVSTKINSDPQLQAYNIDVDADANENRVTLSGDVPTQGLRERIVSMARDAKTDLTITDKIDVEPGEVSREQYTADMATEERERARESGDSIGQDLEDAWIHTKIRSKLVGEGELPFGSINVDVVDKVVTLRGTVESQNVKADAQRIATETEGVSRVNNQLKIKG